MQLPARQVLAWLRDRRLLLLGSLRRVTFLPAGSRLPRWKQPSTVCGGRLTTRDSKKPVPAGQKTEEGTSPDPWNGAPPWTTTAFGLPDYVSNLRPKIYRTVPGCDSTADVEWISKQRAVDKFNSNFWASNNTAFNEAKAAFAAEVCKVKGKVTSEDFSVFYQRFLDDTYSQHMAYNREWYSKNFFMLVPAFRAWLRLIRNGPRRSPS